MAVFHQVEVRAMHVCSEIMFIADHVFPVSPLPDAALATGSAHRRTPFSRRQAPGEAASYRASAGGEVRIAGRQFHDAVQVIGQNHPAMDDKRMRASRPLVRSESMCCVRNVQPRPVFTMLGFLRQPNLPGFAAGAEQSDDIALLAWTRL